MANTNNGKSVSARTTGRYLILFRKDAGEAARAELQARVGVRAVGLEDYADAAARDPSQFGAAGVMLDELGVAVVNAPPERRASMLAAVSDAASPIEAVEPERVVYAIGGLQSIETPANGRTPPALSVPDALPAPPPPEPHRQEPSAMAEFHRGYQAAFRDLVEQLLARQPGVPAGVPSTAFMQALAADAATWGLVATGASLSRFTGKGTRVAILDTGFDLHHPDFEGRTISHASFVAGEQVQDGHGHGTHCVGTACGSRSAQGTRYGVAPQAEIYVGKVLSNAGSGGDAGILAGIAWAVRNKCHVVSMSLGSPVNVGEPYSEIYETVARRAAAQGTIIVAAAGNESERPGFISPVGHPANAPAIIAVGALDRALGVARFSCGGINPGGGEVNVAAPGVDVFSSWPMPGRYRSISGTSMATPHVAGILALAAEATGLRGFELVNNVLRRSRRLFPISDFGWGLAQTQ